MGDAQARARYCDAMMRRSLNPAISLLPLLALAACATDPPPAAHAPGLSSPPRKSAIDHVMGKTAAGLTQMFGDAALDLREGAARKLQFANGVCVLDIYLYPPTAGREPEARYVDARNLNGDDYDKTACISALSRKPLK